MCPEVSVSRRALLLPLLSVLSMPLAGCADKSVPTGPMLREPANLAKAPGEQETKKLFKEYVAMGTSIAAGFMSGGINDSTQLLAYPVLLADRADAKKFDVPLLAKPGCPPPWSAPLTPNAGGCAGRSNDVYPPETNNVSVPGIRVAEALFVQSGTEGALYRLMLGGYTEVQAMLAAKPTFVTAQFGDNDVFQPALLGSIGPVAPGGDSLLTTLAGFRSSYAQIVAAMQSVNQLRGAVLIGVLDPIFASPVLQPGAFFFLSASVTGGSFLGKPVNPNCSPASPFSTNFVSFQILTDPRFTEINCNPDALSPSNPLRGLYLLDAAEQLTIHMRVAQYNAVIAQFAASNGWASFDPNVLIAAALASRTGGQANQLRKCQDLPTATALTLQAAFLTTCPVTGPTAAPNLFGSLISFDGVHPSAEGQVLLANSLALVIDAKYGTSLSNP
jgi:hypothetical protein